MTTEPLPPGWQQIRKKPVTVAAIRWTGSNEAQVQAVTGTASFYAVGPEDRHEDPDQTATVYDELHSTWVRVYTGQWVVKGIEGEFYPLKDSVRVKTYDDVEDVPAVVVATQTIMDGLVLRWYRNLPSAEFGHSYAVVSASRNGVLVTGSVYLHEIPAGWISGAERARELMRDGQVDGAREFATHEHARAFGGELREVSR